MEILLVTTQLPDVKSAQMLATCLIEKRLAACVSILAAKHSTYRWKGKIQSAKEVPLLIKTTTEQYAALESAIRKQHPYELPEIVAVPVCSGLPAYLDWVKQECK